MLKRLIITVAALYSTAMSAQIATKNYGQQLVDEMLIKNPDVLVVMMHVTPPQSQTNIVVASNIGRLGKVADKDDLKVIETGQPNLEVDKSGTRYEVEIPLTDVAGHTIGALGLVFPYHAAQNQDKYLPRATKIRDALARRISNAGNLLDPSPFNPAATTKTFAQKLVNSTLRAHPELLIMAMHVTPPTQTENIIIGSNIGRIGKKADADDLDVISSGKPKLEVDATGTRCEVEMTFRDKSGTQLGAIGFVYRYSPNDSQTELLNNSERIVKALSGKIESLEALTTLNP